MTEAIETIEGETADGRWALRTKLPNGRLVSTVLLLGGGDSPVLAALDVLLDTVYGFEKGPYESIVFEHDGEGADPLHLERYQTDGDARAGHARLVANWRGS